jgi:hypothetical protein
MEVTMRVFVLTFLVASAATPAPMRLRAQVIRPDSPSSLNVLLSAAAAYLDTYEQTFSAVVADDPRAVRRVVRRTCL